MASPSFTYTVVPYSQTSILFTSTGLGSNTAYDSVLFTIRKSGGTIYTQSVNLTLNEEFNINAVLSYFKDINENPFNPTSGVYITTVTIKSSTNPGTYPDTPAANSPQNVTINVGVPCFTSASRLLTPTGYKTADKLRNGDLLVTPDGRQVSIKAFQTRVLGTKETAPFLVPKHSLSASSPAQDLHLSPWHAIQIRKGVWQKPATAAESNSRIVQYGLGEDVTYFHFEAPNYFTDNLVCDGTVVESFANKQASGKVYHYSRALKGYTRSAPVAKKTV